MKATTSCGSTAKVVIEFNYFGPISCISVSDQMEDKNIVNEQLASHYVSTTNALRYNPHFEAAQRNYSVLTSAATGLEDISIV